MRRVYRPEHVNSLDYSAASRLLVRAAAFLVNITIIIIITT